MLSLGLRRIHADHASSLQVPGFRVGTVLTVAGPPFALKEKLDKDIQYEYKTETHENRKKATSSIDTVRPKTCYLLASAAAFVRGSANMGRVACAC